MLGVGVRLREIIVYLLVAAGIDPVTHVRVQHDADAEIEDHQPDENDNNFPPELKSLFFHFPSEQ